jgi:hypothetical protein
VGVRSKGQDRAIRLTENLFCNGAEKQLADAASSVCAYENKIGALSSNDLSQFRPQFTLPNNEFVLNATKSPGSNERRLQLGGFPQRCLLRGGDCTRTYHGQTKGGHHVRQAKSRAVKSSECEGMAQRLLRSLREIGCDQYRAWFESRCDV